MTLEIPENERVHKEDITISDEIKHNYILKQFVTFLKDGKGSIKAQIDAYLDNLVVNFCLTDNAHPFITSNTPAFKLKRDDVSRLLL